MAGKYTTYTYIYIVTSKTKTTRVKKMANRKTDRRRQGTSHYLG